MNGLLRAVRLLAMVVWVGGLIFFAFVLAPVAFHVLPSKHEAGLVVGGTLRVLHEMGVVCYGVFFVATAMCARGMAKARGYWFLTTQLVFVTLMLLATVYVKTSILPAMELDRIAAGGDVDAAAPEDPARLDFERLHGFSEKVEGAALFLGLGIVVLMAAEGEAKAVPREPAGFTGPDVF
jgi:uncharacterized membrane protein